MQKEIVRPYIKAFKRPGPQKPQKIFGCLLLKIVVGPPKSSIFMGVFHYFHQSPFWGQKKTIFGWPPTMCSPLGPALIALLGGEIPWKLGRPLSGTFTKRLKSCRFTKGRPLSKSFNESKGLNHLKDRCYSGQIFQLAVKSYLWFTKGCQGAKMIRGDNSGDSSSFAAKLSPSCTVHRWWYTVQKTGSQKHQPTGKKWRLRFLNLNKHAKQISSFHLQSHFCGHGQLKDWQPHFQPTLVKCSISRIIQCFFSGHMEPSEMGIFLNKSWTPQLREQTPCFSASDGFFLQLRRRDGHEAVLQSWWNVLPFSGTSSFW